MMRFNMYEKTKGKVNNYLFVDKLIVANIHVCIISKQKLEYPKNSCSKSNMTN